MKPAPEKAMSLLWDIFDFDDVDFVCCGKRKLNKDKILVDMIFIVTSNFSSLDPMSSMR